MTQHNYPTPVACITPMNSNTPSNAVVPMVIEQDATGQERSFDIYSRAMRDRIVWMKGQVEENMANIISTQMFILNSENNKKPIYLFCDSPGGSVHAGLTIRATMEIIEAPVIAVTFFGCSMGFYLPSAADLRLVTNYTHMMAHQVSSGTNGQILDQKISLEHSDRLNEQLLTEIAQNCGIELEELRKIVDRDKWMNGKEAIEFGVADGIWGKNGTMTDIEGNDLKVFDEEGNFIWKRK